MPNRTIYLPQELDDLSRSVGLNLSRLAQEAIRDYLADHRRETLEARLEEACARAEALAVDWPERFLKYQRAQAQDR
ncbi:MAG: type II toxin-antitoxin system CcdA family antitoxin [Acidimicrobiaceae bacterium]|nr:ribbon-helix-helix domain-containing protein [Acidimicrobiia bacterium]MCY4492482.1 type II toxin-antitoxin system CcdA family antitoxin [Acidimicrobiaceae bacterium]